MRKVFFQISLEEIRGNIALELPTQGRWHPYKWTSIEEFARQTGGVMGHGHDHGHSHGYTGEISKSQKQRLWFAIAITIALMAFEIVGGLIGGSLALLSDAAHMGSDAAALIISLIAVSVSQKPATKRFPYGFGRIKVLAALINGLMLGGLALTFIKGGIERLLHPHEVHSGTTLLVATTGLLANLLVMYILTRGEQDISMRSAFQDCLWDAIGSVGVILGSLVMMVWSNATRIDAVLTLLIAGMMLRTSYSLVKATTQILMDGAPGDANHGQVEHLIRSIFGVASVQSIKIRSLTGDDKLVSVVLCIELYGDVEEVRHVVVEKLEEKGYQVEHFDVSQQNIHVHHGHAHVH